MWQSAVVELESQRDTSRSENIAMTARLTLMADEVLGIVSI